ncbi:alpha/beta fold hydrolase [Asanoa iriomotensis]|uniref:Alpha/beta hydrolase n=1 Tax=Asanoa iriomotensis TaxID=234613 RepID=A0ABQ4CAG5_9ACTN|nr:alpha/beta hydrolase [Asanoa iriomotensis]GIF59768.1 alpha/beta hydrolase [Asanoa iriomotensis]
MTKEFDLDLGDGQNLHVYDTGRPAPHTVFWHHGTPNLGAPPVPLLDERVRWVSYDRPGYGPSTRVPGRDVSSAARFTTAIADLLGLDRFGVVGHSGGGPHALAVAALLPERVTGVVIGSSPAPWGAEGLDWFGDMAPGAAAAFHAALAGPEARQSFGEQPPGDPDIGFCDADEDALATDWSWVLDVVRPAIAQGPTAAADDDLAYVAPWGFDPAAVSAPVLVLTGTRDRMVPPAHGAWLARQIPSATLRASDVDGHVSVLRRFPDAMAWLTSR